ncbi:hypothetical protein OSTOST_02271 [Ostertagia ostertagi]
MGICKYHAHGNHKSKILQKAQFQPCARRRWKCMITKTEVFVDQHNMYRLMIVIEANQRLQVCQKMRFLSSASRQERTTWGPEHIWSCYGLVLELPIVCVPDDVCNFSMELDI